MRLRLTRDHLHARACWLRLRRLWLRPAAGAETIVSDTFVAAVSVDIVIAYVTNFSSTDPSASASARRAPCRRASLTLYR